MSWKVKRTVFRDWISIIQPEDDWSLFNLVQTIKQKVYNLPRKVIEPPMKIVTSLQVDKNIVIQTTKEKAQKSPEIQTPQVVKQKEEAVPQSEDKTLKSPQRHTEKIPQEIKEEDEILKNPEVILPAVTMVPTIDTLGDSNLTKRKPEITSDRE